jgi:hypothetical protein
MEKPTPLQDAMNEELAKKSANIPIWLGRAVGPDSQRLNPVDDPMRGYWG